MNPAITLTAAAGLATAAAAQTIVTVDTARDGVDFGGARMVDDLPGPDGRITFREALMATNNTPGPQTIGFAVPRNEWWWSDVMAMLENDSGTFVVSDDETTIDFMTQTAFTGDTNPNGRECGVRGTFSNGMGSPAIVIYGDNCVVRGMAEVQWRRESVVLSGSHNRIVQCVTGQINIEGGAEHATHNVIGGSAPEDANDLFFVNIVCGADDNVVIGNHIENVFVGASPYCDTSSRNRIGGPTPEERNVINGFGYFSSEGFPVGEGIEVSWATDTLIEGNYIGVNADGTARVQQTGPTGIEINDSDNTTIRGNLIAGLRTVGRNHYQGQVFGQAILVNAINRDNFNVVIENNLIGTDFTGLNPITTLNGVVVSSQTARQAPFGTRIGGAEPGQGNLIAFCERRGVGVAALMDEVEISGNAIHSSGELGIDLATNNGFDGVTPNDPGDADTNGANDLQNFPVLDMAETDGAAVTITGVLNSRPDREYRIEFFASGECDPSGHGEGERFLGFTTVTTDGAGDATFSVSLPAPVAQGDFVTATATEIAATATSEFSACIQASQGGCAADLDGDGDADADDFFAYLDLFATGDPEADLDGDGDTDADDFFSYLDVFAAGC